MTASGIRLRAISSHFDIFQAAAIDELEIIEKLAKAGGNASATDKEGVNAMLFAANAAFKPKFKVDIVKRFLEMCLDVNCSTSEEGITGSVAWHHEWHYK